LTATLRKAYPQSMDSLSQDTLSTRECTELCPLELLDKQRRKDASPLRTALRAYLAAYPTVTAARVGPMGEDL
jgi:hypothetical protein